MHNLQCNDISRMIVSVQFIKHESVV